MSQLLKDFVNVVKKMRHGLCKIIMVRALTKDILKKSRTKKCNQCGFTEKSNKKNCPVCNKTRGGVMESDMEWPAELVNLERWTLSVSALYNSYEDLINNQLKRSGEVPDYEAKKGNNVPLKDMPNKFLRQGIDTDGKLKDIFYLRVFIGHLTANHRPEVHYIADGKVVDHLVTQELKDEYFPKAETSEYKNQFSAGEVKLDKQFEAGVLNEIELRDPKIENVKYVQCGDNVLNLIPEQIMSVFNLETVN